MSLVVKGLRSVFLDGIDLEVGEGEVIAIGGASGSGKTLFLRALADLDPNDGAVALGDRSRAAMPGPAWRRLVRFVAAEPGWWADRVGDHFSDPDEAAKGAVRLKLPADCMGWPIARLSTGEKQRLAFLRAIEDDPPVLLLDEPTAALDPDAEEATETMIRERAERGTTVLLVTHSVDQAARLARQRFRMEAGRLTPLAP